MSKDLQQPLLLASWLVATTLFFLVESIPVYRHVRVKFRFVQQPALLYPARKAFTDGEGGENTAELLPLHPLDHGHGTEWLVNDPNLPKLPIQHDLRSSASTRQKSTPAIRVLCHAHDHQNHIAMLMHQLGSAGSSMLLCDHSHDSLIQQAPSQSPMVWCTRALASVATIRNQEVATGIHGQCSPHAKQLLDYGNSIDSHPTLCNL